VNAFYSVPRNFPIALGFDFEPGMLADFNDKNEVILSNGRNVIGIIDDIRDSQLGQDTTMVSGKVTIWHERIVLQTDQFERSEIYNCFDPLFASKNALFTTFPEREDDPCVGMVLSPPKSTSPVLEFEYDYYKLRHLDNLINRKAYLDKRRDLRIIKDIIE
jgi:hypothetical protein